MENNNLENTNKLISSASDFIGTLGGAITGGVIGGPGGAAVGVVAGKGAGLVLEKVGKEILERIISPRQKLRTGAVYGFAYGKIKEYVNNGKEIPRMAEFFAEETGRSIAEELLEGTVYAAQMSFEEKKVPYLGYLFANIIFDEDTSREEGNMLITLAERLRYRQYLILNILNNGANFCKDKNEPSVVNCYAGVNFGVSSFLSNDLSCELLDLKNMGLINIIYSNSERIDVGKASITHFGNKLTLLLELNKIDIDEIDKLHKEIRGS